MYAVFHEFISAAEELCCYYDDGRCAISNLKTA